MLVFESRHQQFPHLGKVSANPGIAPPSRMSRMVKPDSRTKTYTKYQFELRIQQIPIRAWQCQAPSEFDLSQALFKLALPWRPDADQKLEALGWKCLVQPTF